MTSEPTERLPETADALIDWLDSKYPHRCIGSNETLEGAHRRAGARALIDELIELRDAEVEGEG